MRMNHDSVSRGGSQCKYDIYNYKEKTAVISQMLNVTITVITTLLGSITLDIIIINIWSIRHPLWISVAGELRARIIFHSNWHHNEVIAEGLRSLQKLKLLRSVFICGND